MYIFEVSYGYPGARFLKDIVVCENYGERNVKAIIAMRRGVRTDAITDFNMNEVSPEQVNLRDLTIADFMRITRER